MTTFLVPKNTAYSTLASGINDSVLALTVATGEGSNFPSTYPFRFSIDSELLGCTNRSSDVLTITRGEESSTPASHSSGAVVYMNPTAQHISDLNTAVNTLENLWGDDEFAEFGGVASLGWETQDANANALILDLPIGDVVDVPVFASGIGIKDQDLGFFNGKTFPMHAIVDNDRDSWIGFGFNIDDDAQIMIGGSARLKIPGWRLSGLFAPTDFPTTHLHGTEVVAEGSAQVTNPTQTHLIGSLSTVMPRQTSGTPAATTVQGFYGCVGISEGNTQDWDTSFHAVRGLIYLGTGSYTIYGASSYFSDAILDSGAILHYLKHYEVSDAFGDGTVDWEQYGLYVRELTKAPLNWGVYILANDSFFGGDIKLDGILTMKETTTPSALASYGKIYTQSDNKLYFQDGAGVEHEIAYVP